MNRDLKYDAILFPSDGKEYSLVFYAILNLNFIRPPTLACTTGDEVNHWLTIAHNKTLFRALLSPMSTPHHSAYTTVPSRMPHPEVFMDYIAEGLGPRAWKYHLVEALDGMNRKFTNPYIIFYPTISRDGMPFPINKSIREIQARAFREETAWRGNVVIAKYCDNPFSSMMNTSMADFAILRNYLMTHGAPR